MLARCWADTAPRSEEMGLRFVAGRPLSAVTIDFLRAAVNRKVDEALPAAAA